MGRVTRKRAAEIAEQLHVDEDAVLDMDPDNAVIKAQIATPEPSGRAPLGEIEPNSAESRPQEEEPVEELKKSTGGRKGGKKGAAKGKKNNNLAASTATLPEDGGNVVADDNESAPSPASEKAAEELVSNDEPELQAANDKLQPDRSQSPPSAAVRLTRSQLVKRTEVEEHEPKSLVDGLGRATEEGQEDYFVSDDNPAIETSAPQEVSETMGANTNILDAPASPLPTAVPNVIKNLRSDTPAKRSTSNKENVQPESDADSMASPRVQSSAYDALEDAVVAAATPPRSEAHASPRAEDPIAAMDELEDAVENVNKDIPEVQPSPMKAKTTKQEQSGPAPVVEAPKTEEKKIEPKKENKKAAPVVRTTKAAQARLSMAQNKDASSKAPGLGRPRPSVALGRSTSVRQSTAPKPEGASKRVPSNPTTKSLKTSTSNSAGGEPREKKEAVIPHSKPRPISLSFPTPPPPQKSTKATTSSTFQLPGEAVAAKLKAAREARMAREAEEAEKKDRKPAAAFKARPAPAPTATGVRQTNASRARESMIAGKPAPTMGHKRANTVANTERPRTVSKETAAGKPATASAASKPRPSTSLANLAKPRITTTTTGPAITTAPRVPSSGTSTAKGREVFNRASAAKAAAEKEKADKEAAAKKARAEAAERGRVKSREWAEKQRLRKLGVKTERKTGDVLGDVAKVEEAEKGEQAKEDGAAVPEESQVEAVAA